jgi:hypothetical protein
MKKNENIFISLEIQKDIESKGLFLSVVFDRNAPNFSFENETITWLPTIDELDFIKEAFEIMGGNQVQLKEIEEPQEIENPLELDATEHSHRSSEIRIAPLPNNIILDETENLKPSCLKNKGNEEKIFIQADERKIDEILQRKKNATKRQFDRDLDDKALIDKMMKQKKKK